MTTQYMRPEGTLAPFVARLTQDTRREHGDFLGRRAELLELGRLVRRDDIGWVTVTGRSGVGKSALLAEFSRSLVADGCAVIDWDGQDAGDVIGALQLPSAARPRRQDRADGRNLRSIGVCRLTVIVADDAQAIDRGQTEELAALVRREPAITVVAASVVPLGVPWEMRMPLGGLSVDELEPESRWGSPAVDLFVDRLRRTDPSFDPDHVDLHDIEAVCALLHGVPGDIEVCAATARLLGVKGVAAELAGDPSQHEGGAGQSSSQSTWPALEVSYGYLSAGAQELFASMSVFRGRFSLDEIRSVHRGTSDGDVVEHLSELVDAWLVERDPFPASPTPYFSLAPVSRGFAAARAETGGDLATLRERHTDPCVTLARDCAEALDDCRDHDGFIRMAALMPDLVDCAERLLDEGAVDESVRLCCDIAPVATRLGLNHRVGHLLARLLGDPRSGTVDLATRGDALVWRAELLLESVSGIDLVETAMRLWRAGMALCREHGTTAAQLRSLGIGARSVMVTGDVATTLGLLEEGRTLADEVGHVVWRTRFAIWQGMMAHVARDYESALRICSETIVVSRRSGDLHGQVLSAMVLVPLRGRLPPDGDEFRKLPTATELVALAGATGDPYYRTIAMGALVAVLIADGDAAGAALWMQREVAGVGDAKTWRMSGHLLLQGFRLAVLMGEAEEAAVLLGAIEPILPMLTVGSAPEWIDGYQEDTDRLRAMSSEEGLAAASREGSQLAWVDAIERALAVADRVVEQPGRGQPVSVDDHPTLTPRERQVIDLIVEGFTNPEIARRLRLTPKSVMHHASAIYRKLGVRGRAEAVAWELRREL